MAPQPSRFIFFFFNDTATTEIYTLSLHDALPIWSGTCSQHGFCDSAQQCQIKRPDGSPCSEAKQCTGSHCERSEEHTSELQSRPHLVCRLLLEKKQRISVRACSVIG